MPLNEKEIDTLLAQIKIFREKDENVDVPVVMIQSGGKLAWPHSLSEDVADIELDDEGYVESCVFISYDKNDRVKIMADDLIKGEVRVYDLEPSAEVQEIVQAQHQAGNKRFIEAFTRAMKEVGHDEDVIDECVQGDGENKED